MLFINWRWCRDYEDLPLLGGFALSVGSLLPVFQDCLLVLPSEVKRFKNLWVSWMQTKCRMPTNIPLISFTLLLLVRNHKYICGHQNIIISWQTETWGLVCLDSFLTRNMPISTSPKYTDVDVGHFKYLWCQSKFHNADWSLYASLLTRWLCIHF